MATSDQVKEDLLKLFGEEHADSMLQQVEGRNRAIEQGGMIRRTADNPTATEEPTGDDVLPEASDETDVAADPAEGEGDDSHREFEVELNEEALRLITERAAGVLGGSVAPTIEGMQARIQELSGALSEAQERVQALENQVSAMQRANTTADIPRAIFTLPAEGYRPSQREADPLPEDVKDKATQPTVRIGFGAQMPVTPQKTS